MKCLLSMVMAMLVGMQVSGAVALSNVKIQQRYPWNGKVDISFNLASTRTDIGIKFEAFDTAKGVPVQMSTIYGDDGARLEYPYRLTMGTHHLVWEASSDVPAGYQSDSLAVNITARPVTVYPKYCVIDLSEGPSAASYPISYLDDVPIGGWSEEYKTTKLLFRFCPPGTFREGPNGNFITTAFSDGGASRIVTLTKPFYIGVYPISEKQWRLVMGGNLGTTATDANRKYYTTYNLVRGTNKAYQFPNSYEVDEDSFVGKVRARSIPQLDLPTEAQWEYACKAGVPTDDDGYLIDMNGKRYTDLSGMFDPNAWGIYGIADGWELCIDWLVPVYGTSSVVDPVGCTRQQSVVASVAYNALRGCYSNKKYAWGRTFNNCAQYDPETSFRLAIWLERD